MNNRLLKIKKALNKDKKFHIAFLGDSQTSTEWVHPNWREVVEYVLKEELTKILKDWKLPSWGIRCFNCGFDGATTKDLLELSENRVISLKPDMLISVFGGNDLTFKFSLADHKKYNEKLINKLTGSIDDVVYCSTVPDNNGGKRKDFEPYVKTFKELLPKENLTFVDLFHDFRKYDLNRFFTFIDEGGIPELGIKPGGIDFSHPNSLGQCYIAKELLKQIFKIEFDPEKYLNDLRNDKKYPNY